jgi:hypothetical protein
MNWPLQGRRKAGPSLGPPAAGRLGKTRVSFETTPIGTSPSCYDSRRMECPTARILFENYARAAVELFESADKLATRVGQHDKFAEAKKYSKQTHEKCYSARLALEQHRAEHGCRERVASEL